MTLGLQPELPPGSRPKRVVVLVFTRADLSSWGRWQPLILAPMAVHVDLWPGG